MFGRKRLNGTAVADVLEYALMLLPAGCLIKSVSARDTEGHITDPCGPAAMQFTVRGIILRALQDRGYECLLGGDNELFICELLADFLKLPKHPFGAPSAISDWNMERDEGYIRAALENAVRWLRKET